MANFRKVENIGEYIKYYDEYKIQAIEKTEYYVIRSATPFERVITIDEIDGKTVRGTKILTPSIKKPHYVAVLSDMDGNPIEKNNRLVKYEATSSEIGSKYTNIKNVGFNQLWSKAGNMVDFFFVPENIKFGNKMVKAGSYINIKTYEVFSDVSFSDKYNLSKESSKKFSEKKDYDLYMKEKRDYRKRVRDMNKVDDKTVNGTILAGLMCIAENEKDGFAELRKKLSEEVGFTFSLEEIRQKYPNIRKVKGKNDAFQYIAKGMLAGDYSAAALLIAMVMYNEEYCKKLVDDYLNVSKGANSIYYYIQNRLPRHLSQYSPLLIKEYKKLRLDERFKSLGDFPLRCKVNEMLEQHIVNQFYSEKEEIENTEKEVTEGNNDEHKEAAMFQNASNISETNKRAKLSASTVLKGIRCIVDKAERFSALRDKFFNSYSSAEAKYAYAKFHAELKEALKEVGCEFTSSDKKLLPLLRRNGVLMNEMFRGKADIVTAFRLIVLANEADDMSKMESVMDNLAWKRDYRKQKKPTYGEMIDNKLNKLVKLEEAKAERAKRREEIAQKAQQSGKLR